MTQEKRVMTLVDISPRGDEGCYYCSASSADVICPICICGYDVCLHSANEVREFLVEQSEADEQLAAQAAALLQRAEFLVAARRELAATNTHAARKTQPLLDGLLGYFPNACAYVSHVSLRANEQHNPGEPMHWAFDKSVGTGNEIARHLCERGALDTDGLRHTGKVAWRALELLERELLAAYPALKPGLNVRNFTRESAKQEEKK